ncbi:hypothetical protein [Halochromatium salexigens]|uniref:Uncharacterized protein n=1 Tax=Halochromatium salexigens TaxID=49447 RepID=A0AAJ0UGB1_HALSE|nr:hypothetical protein [Halochromatium salexigens]MBK5930927.1 hypothetical protein [Halochromatium salexigens]
MQKGYLLLETEPDQPPDQPDVVLVSTQDHEPRPDRPGLGFVACFDDIEAASMHLHERLRHQLITLEPRRYAVTLEEAVIAADAIELDHRRTFIDPALAERARLDRRIEALHRQHRWHDRLLHAVGAFAVILLLLWGMLPR